MYVTGTITTTHTSSKNISLALSPDNGDYIHIVVDGNRVIATIEGDSLRSIITSVDDYMMNLSISEQLS